MSDLTLDAQALYTDLLQGVRMLCRPDTRLVGITSGGVATSSTLVRNWSTGTGRAHHIIDPRTGGPVDSPWRTVSVAANSCLTANAYSTASLLWGEEALYYVTQAGWAARFVDHDGKVLCVGGWPQEVAS